MLKNIKLLGLTICLAVATSVQAEEIYTQSRAGEPQRVDDGTEFKVCADQDNLPYSNNKIFIDTERIN